MVDAVVEVDVQANLGKLETGLEKARDISKKADAELNKLGKSTQSVTRTQQVFAQGLTAVERVAARANQAFEKSTVALAAMRRHFSLAEGALLGYTARAAAAAAGSGELAGRLLAIGGRAGGLVAIPVLAAAAAIAMATLADSSAKLRNSLLTLPAVSTQAGASFEFLKQLAEETKTPLSTLTEEYQKQVTELSALRVPLTEINQRFADTQRAISNLKVDTLSDAFGRLRDAFSNRFSSSGFRDLTVAGIDWITNFVKPAQSQVESFADRLKEIDKLIPEVQRRLEQAKQLFGFGTLRNEQNIQAELNALLKERSDIIQKQASAQSLLFANAKTAVESVTNSLKEELEVRQFIVQAQRNGQTLAQAEAQAQVLRMRQQALARAPQTPEGQMAAKSALGGAEGDISKALMEQAALQDSMRASQFELQRTMALITGQRTVLDSESLSWSAYADKVQEAFRRVQESNLDTTEVARAQAEIRRQLQLREQEQVLQTAELAAQALTTLWPKSKAAAIASAVINTSVGITRALSSIDPPLSYIQAALIAAMGAKQIATIRSTNPGGGGSTPSVGGGGGGTAGQTVAAATPTAAETPTPGNVLTIELKRHQRYTTDEVDDLMERIAERTRDGKTFLETKIV